MATRMLDRRPAAALTDPHERIAAIVGRHGDLLLRVARGYSLCADDAHDAVQRALEIYMRRLESLDPATELAWLKVVVKHEALAVRRGRAGVAGEELDLDAVPALAQRTVEERLESNERVERSAEVMRRLKRDEARALMLKAEGLSYNEIGERLGWTYTKVNRCITEGRRRFMKLYAELETGAECERLAPVVAALGAGTATPEALLELRPHLRNCAGCRATVRTLHASRLPRLTAFPPIAALVAPARAFVERLRGGGGEPPAGPLHPIERQQELEEAFRRLDDGGDAIQPAASSAAEGVGRVSQVRLNARAWLESALQRLHSSDVAVGIHTIGASGGGRITSIAALIGVCVSGVGAGTYCVATALLPDPEPAVRTQAVKPAKARTHRTRRIHLPAHTRRVVVAAPRATPSGTATPRATATATARPLPASSPAPTASPGGNRQPTRAAPPAPAGEFSFEAGSASTASTSPSAAGPSRSSPSRAQTGAAPRSTQSGGEPSNGGGDEFSP